MLAVSFVEYNEFGCPNCGCDSVKVDMSYIGGQPGVTCRHCKLHFQLLAEGMDKGTTGFGTGRKDENGKDIYEYPKRIEHPRWGIKKWTYVKPDVRPLNGEYWQSRGVGYPDISGFVKSKQAGERLLEVVKEVLGVEKPKTFLDYRPSEPDWIQFKFHKDEFDLEKLDSLVTEGIITKGIIQAAKL